VRHLLNTVKRTNVIERVDTRGQAAVKAEDLIFNQGSQRQVVEEICEIFPHIGIAVFSETLIVEAVNLGDLTRFVVTTEDGDALGVSDLEGDKERDCLDGVVSTVNVITWQGGVSTRAVNQPRVQTNP
jgi:hypothetical protein